MRMAYRRVPRRYEEMRTGRSIQIVSCDTSSGKPIKLDKEALENIFNNPSISNMPVVLLSIVGAYRTGKSFLLNFLMRYLTAKEKKAEHNWLAKSDGPLSGFPWASGAERTTEGINIWDRPFIIKLPSHVKVAVFVMDSQGLFDGQVSSVQANILVTLSTLLSSIQIYNVMRTIDESDLKYLELFAESGSIMMDTNEGKHVEKKPFQRLVFLVRDWIGGRQHKFGETGGSAYLEKKLTPAQHMPEEGIKLRTNIKKSFQLLNCFLLPNPGLKAVQQDEDSDDNGCQQEFRGLLKDLSERFIKKLEELVESLFSNDRILVKECAGLRAKCSDMPALFMRYVSLFADGDMPKPSTTRQALLDQYNSMVATKIMQIHGDDVLKMIQSARPCMTPRDVSKILIQAEKKSLEQFEGECRGNDADTQVVRETLIERFKDQEKILLAENDKMMYQQKERHRVFCKEQLELAEKSYLNSMRELRTDKPIPVEVDVLEKLHKSAAEAAKRIFLSATEDKEEERIPFFTNLIDFLGDHHRRYSVENHIKMNQQNMELNQRYMAIGTAEETYVDQMDRIYKTGRLPKSEEEFEEDHKEHIRKAINDYKRLTKDVPKGSKEDLEKLETFFKKQKQRFQEINTGNKSWTQDNDNHKEGRGYFEARMAYRRGMSKECSMGRPHRNPNQMRELHEIYKVKAYSAFKEFEKECFTAPKDWQGFVDSMLEEEYKDILPKNELNHPEVLRLRRKDTFKMIFSR